VSHRTTTMHLAMWIGQLTNSGSVGSRQRTVELPSAIFSSRLPLDPALNGIAGDATIFHDIIVYWSDTAFPWHLSGDRCSSGGYETAAPAG
jgi:hypothetical protein